MRLTKYRIYKWTELEEIIRARKNELMIENKKLPQFLGLLIQEEDI